MHDGDGIFPVAPAPEPAPMLPVPPALLVTAPKVRRRAIAANVSNSPAVADVSIVLVPAAEVKLGTLTLIGFDTTTELPLGSLSLLLDSFSLLPRTG